MELPLIKRRKKPREDDIRVHVKDRLGKIAKSARNKDVTDDAEELVGGLAKGDC